MSHRKFEAPRHGSLAFLPRKRARSDRGRIKSYPKDVQSKKPHLTAFLGYKAGMTHVVRQVNRVGSKLNNKECLDAVTIVEVPPMVVVGVVGYKETVNGLKTIGSVFTQNLSDDFRRNYAAKWFKNNKKMFTSHNAKYDQSKEKREKTLDNIRKNAVAVRVIAHTQPRMITQLKRRKADVVEIQINGGDIKEKVAHALSLLGQQISVDSVFAKDEPVDLIGVTKGRGTKGVVSRWGVRRLPRKTHRGLRRVACIGAWHPARVSFSVARAGQKGFFHRTVKNKKIYRIGKALNTEEGKTSASTEFDLTTKSITPMGGFVRYGVVRNDWVMIKGAVQGPSKRVITLRKTIIPDHAWNRKMKEEITLKFIDTSSKLGHGKFQTSEEKAKFMGPLKRHLEKKREEDEKKVKALKEKREREETQQ
ncbi:hypothetical protein ABK040_008873 [Willaertia magna]